MDKALLNNISHKEYQTVKGLPLERCEIIARLANLKISLNDTKIPGELILKTLHRAGCTAEKFRQYVTTAMNTKIIHTFYKPHYKVAILIANDKYTFLSKLVTPSIDCDSLGMALEKLGFVVVIIKNSIRLKATLEKIFEVIPENSYCFTFYAGHGCELCNTRCMMNIDCPVERITMDHCVTESFILNQVSKCKPELCVFIMDMCRVHLDRTANPDMFAAIPVLEPIELDCNFLISYSAQSSQAAYEVLQIECSTTIDNDVTYEMKTGDSGRIVPRASQYVNALCSRIADDLDVSAMLDKVHADVECSMRKQKPIKIKCGSARRSLYDPATGDKEILVSKLKEISVEYEELSVL